MRATAQSLQDTMPAESPIDFNIPAQSLATALEAFSIASGYQILMADAASGTDMSKAVKGVLSPTQALMQMTSGTGMEVRFTGIKAAILTRSTPASSPRLNDQEQFEARLQKDVMRALCQTAATRPGDYRTALDLWVDTSGHVERIEQLSSSGDPDRDKKIVGALDALRSAPPPSGLAQPTTLLLVPGLAGSVHACDAFSSNVQRARAR